MQSPRVSVVIPSYNHAQFVGAAIDSVLAQTLSDFELIIIDDGSKDDSVATIQRRLSQLNDDRVLLIARENRGLCRTLNEGLLMARGRYFAYLGSDDLWEPAKVQKQVDSLASAGQNAAASFTDCYIIDQHTKRLDRFGRQYQYHGGDIYRDLIRMRFMPPSPTNLFVREKLIFAGGFNESLPIEDYNAWLRLSRYYRVVFVPEALASFRVHTSNTSTTYPEKIFVTSLESLQWAFRVDPALAPMRRRTMARLNAHDAAAYYNALNFREARRRSTKALRAYPFDWLAWRVLIRSLLGPLVIQRLRGFRTGHLMSRGPLQ